LRPMWFNLARLLGHRRLLLRLQVRQLPACRRHSHALVGNSDVIHESDSLGLTHGFTGHRG
jgi:hypothetical protein